MDEKKPIPAEPRSTEPETPTVSRGISPGAGGARSGGPAKRDQSRQTTTEPQRVEIVLRVVPAEPQQTELPKPVAEVATEPASVPSTATEPVATHPGGPHPTSGHPLPSDGRGAGGEGREAEPQQIPARMLNEFVYCQRLFYYEFVEGVFVESADTLRGAALHQRVDSGSGAMPAASKSKAKSPKPKVGEKATEAVSQPSQPGDQSLVTS